MEFWRNLSDRERTLIMAAAALFALFVAIQGVLVPIAGWRDDQRRALDQSQALYDLVALAAAQSGGLSTGAGDDQTPVRNALSQSAQIAGINLVYVNVKADGSVDANVAQVDPEALFDWLRTIEGQYGVRVVSADIARERDQNSMVRAQLTFARSGG